MCTESCSFGYNTLASARSHLSVKVGLAFLTRGACGAGAASWLGCVQVEAVDWVEVLPSSSEEESSEVRGRGCLMREGTV